MFLNQDVFNVSSDYDNETLYIFHELRIENKIANIIENLVLDDSHKILFSKNFELLKSKYKKNVKSVFNIEDLKKCCYDQENSFM